MELSGVKAVRLGAGATPSRLPPAEAVPPTQRSGTSPCYRGPGAWRRACPYGGRTGL